MSLLTINGTLDSETGSAYFRLTTRKTVTAKSVDANIEYDEHGNIVAFEVLDFFNQNTSRKAKMQTIPVAVYSTPNCVQCMSTKRMLEKNGIEFTEYDLSKMPEKLEEFKAQGHVSAPIVVTDIKVWSGFRKTKIDSLIQAVRSEQARD